MTIWEYKNMIVWKYENLSVNSKVLAKSLFSVLVYYLVLLAQPEVAVQDRLVGVAVEEGHGDGDSMELEEWREDLWSDPYCGNKNKPAILGYFLEQLGQTKNFFEVEFHKIERSTHDTFYDFKLRGHLKALCTKNAPPNTNNN